MAYLTLLLTIKIAVTFVLVAAPFLLLSKSKLESAMLITAQSAGIFRLYGVAVLALLVGYAFGVPAAQSGHFPWGVTTMGAVSNGGAALILVLSGAASRKILLVVFFGLIFAGLTMAMLFPDIAMTRLW